MTGDAAHGDPVVAVAADEAYAIPLGVTVRSAIGRLGAQRRLRVFVVDGGLTPASRERLLRSWDPGRARVEWLVPDRSATRDLPSGGHMSLATYARILLARLLPQDLERVLYLDTDVLVRADLCDLWSRPLEGHTCLAVQDAGTPFVDAEQALPGYAARGAHVLTPRPIENYRDLGLDPRAPYMNTGVLLMDLELWRAEQVEARVLRCLAENRRWVRFWDQYALNVVLSGRWGALEPRWNVSPYLAGCSTWRQGPYPREAFERALADPSIVHFLGPEKPWQLGCRLPWADEWRACCRELAWSAPERARFTLAARARRERGRLAKAGRRSGKRLRPALRRLRRGLLRGARRLRAALRGGERS